MKNLINNFILGRNELSTYNDDSGLDDYLTYLKECYATTDMSIEEFEGRVKYVIANWEPLPKSRFTSDTIRK